jgi:hypothetical protein
MEPISIFDRFIIIDNFYTDPDAVRNHALSLPKEDVTGGNYSGIMSLDHFLTPEHLSAFAKVFGHEVSPSTQLAGKFRFSQIGNAATQNIHFDPGLNQVWAGVWYGSKEHPEVDGTAFWKHKRTGLESIPPTQEGIEQYGWNGVDDLKLFLETDGVDYSKWDKTFSVPYKYNRCVFFRPLLFHSPGPEFGTDLESARLVQTFFFSPNNCNAV